MKKVILKIIKWMRCEIVQLDGSVSQLFYKIS